MNKINFDHSQETSCVATPSSDPSQLTPGICKGLISSHLQYFTYTCMISPNIRRLVPNLWKGCHCQRAKIDLKTVELRSL